MGINRTPFTLTEGRQFSKLEQQMIWKNQRVIRQVKKNCGSLKKSS